MAGGWVLKHCCSVSGVRVTLVQQIPNNAWMSFVPQEYKIRNNVSLVMEHSEPRVGMNGGWVLGVISCPDVRARPTNSYRRRRPRGFPLHIRGTHKNLHVLYSILDLQKHYTHAVKVCIEYLNVLEHQLPSPETQRVIPPVHIRPTKPSCIV